MNYKEAIDKLTQLALEFESGDMMMACVMGCEAIEMRIPKRALKSESRKNSLGGYGIWKACPNCEFTFGYHPSEDEVSYCPKCGQAIDWSSDTE